MKLLEPEKVEKATTTEEKRLQSRVNDMRGEERRAVDDLNTTIHDCEKEKKRVKEETDTFVADQEKRAAEAKNETDRIETFRKNVLAELLRPIWEQVEEIRKKAEDALRSVTEREADCDRKEKDVAEDRAKNFEVAENLKDKEDDLHEREQSLIPREKGCKAEADRLKESSETLAKNWSEYHITVRDESFKLSEQRRILDDREKALQSYAETLRQARGEIDEDKKSLKSRYVALEAAIAEFEEKKKQHGTST